MQCSRKVAIASRMLEVSIDHHIDIYYCTVTGETLDPQLGGKGTHYKHIPIADPFLKTTCRVSTLSGTMVSFVAAQI